MENFFSTASGLGESSGITKDGKVSTVGVYIASVLLIFVVVVFLFWWFMPRADHVTAMGPYILNGANATVDTKTNSTETVFNNAQVESNLGNNFTLAFFVYMDDVTRERITIGGPEGDFRFKPFVYILGVGDVQIDPIHQVAHVRVKPLDRNGVMDRGGIVTVDIANFMIARWNQVVITIEGRSLDVYLNGVIAGSALLENLPIVKPVGVLLDKSPDFAGQAGLFQAWSRRLTESEIARNYKRNTNTRGKPLIPDVGPSLLSIFKDMGKGLCDIGFCGFRFRVGPMEYVDYEFA
jgi:hypothetical protein